MSFDGPYIQYRYIHTCTYSRLEVEGDSKVVPPSSLPGVLGVVVMYLLVDTVGEVILLTLPPTYTYQDYHELSHYNIGRNIGSDNLLP